jgi:outer membrane protein assembly factor BamB
MQDKVRFFSLVSLLASIFFLGGCSNTHLPISTLSPAPTSTTLPTTTSVPILIPTPSATALRTSTPSPVPSAVPTRTATGTVSTAMGWTANQGGPDSARANLAAKLRPPLKLAWEWKEPNDKPEAVAIANSQVFLLTSGGQFCILDTKSGVKKICRPVWQETKGSTTGQVALSGDTVVVCAFEIYVKPGDRYGTGRSRLVAFSLDGQPRWALPVIEDQGSAGIVPGGGSVVSITRTGIDKYLITSFDIANGAQRWQIPGYFNHGASDGTNFYTDDKNTAAWRLSTGERVWEQTTDAKHVLYAQGRIFAVGDHTIAGLDAATGKLLWKTDFGVFPLTHDQVGVAAAHDHLYVIPPPGETRHGFRPGVIALDAATGKEVWSALLDPKDEQSAEHIAATSDSLVVVGTVFGDTIVKQLWVINAQNGAELDRVVISNDSMWQPSGLAVADDQVYVLGDTLRVYGPSQSGK